MKDEEYKKKIAEFFKNFSRDLFILIPGVLSADHKTRTEEEKFSHNWGKDEYCAELQELCAELQVFDQISILMVTLSDFEKIIEEKIPDKQKALIFNLCDGNELDGFPGHSVSRVSPGASSAFNNY